jgi:hypothetical protein
MGLLERLFTIFQAAVQLQGRVDSMSRQMHALIDQVFALEMRVVRLETLLEVKSGERLPPLRRPSSSDPDDDTT